ncbi:hypothetical protein PPL_03784 [Heterostelium album PN500]|uniref:FNIP repeat-containing protein n=1 Tax=Heterostelium pallidum (strain ATCC 26659 / Pp 5 / PN500) TaxID=670386 RepID=D3B6N3_HETP5|nr:hypothetical protein PPL_03784 [Heterostelium album PN500]EFA83003.1 hypothetical protein PPL_03784 [Heterostelium album PN500]|eukprot:XP_020435120.1 hypothetical protein PPL_03784 [Heterostelium album PN500]
MYKYGVFIFFYLPLLHNEEFSFKESQIDISKFDYVIFNDTLINSKAIITIPKTITNLYLCSGIDMEKILKVCNDTTVTNLVFSTNFNCRLPPSLIPSNITNITFGDKFNCNLEIGSLPKHLEQLVFGSSFNCWLSPGQLPDSLQSITFGESFTVGFGVGSLPLNLRKLKSTIMNYHFGVTPDTLPPKIEKIIGFAVLIDDKLMPKTIKHISLSPVKNMKNCHYTIPLNLTSLCLFRFDFKPSILLLPLTLKKLNLGFYDKELELGFIPNSVKRLNLGYAFNQYLYPKILPNTIRWLKFPDTYNIPFEEGSIPEGVTTLILNTKISLQTAPLAIVEQLTISQSVTLEQFKTIPKSVKIIHYQRNDKDDQFEIKRIDVDDRWLVIHKKNEFGGFIKSTEQLAKVLQFRVTVTSTT